MTNFADHLSGTMKRNNSVLCAGFDPRIERIPAVFHAEASRLENAQQDFYEVCLRSFYTAAIDTLRESIAAVKPNIAFFEQYGIGGLKALQWICRYAKEAGLPVILDAKRGDIGSTAEAYAKAYFPDPNKAHAPPFLEVDAVTVNPFLGFDTIEPFLKVCEDSGRGIFVLVRTSNPGAADIEAVRGVDGSSVSERIAAWLAENSERLMGNCGFSGLGAVVGASDPKEAKHLRELLPKTQFLIPGYGAQGGSAADALAGLIRREDGTLAGGVVNSSRGITLTFSDLDLTATKAAEEIKRNAETANQAFGC